MRIEYAVISHEGNIRKSNEDNYFLNGIIKENVFENRKREKEDRKGKRFVFSVCDGMGGEDYGEIASLCSVKAMKVFEKLDLSKQSLEQFLAIAKNTMKKQLTNDNTEECGTTITIIMFYKNIAYAVNLGDSRIYLFRKENLIPLSKDHTQAQLMIEHGMLTLEEAKKHKTWHILTRYLGVKTEVFADDFYYQKPFKIEKEDIFLLCSDGLTDMLTERKLKECIQKDQNKKAEILAEALCKQALEAGGKDNITCLIAKIKGLDREKKFLDYIGKVFNIE